MQTQHFRQYLQIHILLCYTILRLEEKEALPGLYREFGESFRKLDSWSAYMITSYEDAERYFGRKADKNRKIYNGMLKTYFYQFQGPKPPRPKK